MKISKQQLQELVKEEIQKSLNETGMTTKKGTVLRTGGGSVEFYRKIVVNSIKEAKEKLEVSSHFMDFIYMNNSDRKNMENLIIELKNILEKL